MTDPAGFRLEHTYAALPQAFHADAPPASFKSPRLAVLNEPLAAELGLSLSAISSDAVAALFAGNALPAGGRRLAQAYAGHQFGHFTMLGDGRAVLVAEHRAPSGDLFDIHLKGAGRTRFSRGGDGKAALGPMLREYIVGEAMHGLGIPTTRALAVVTTGETVYRETPRRGAVLARVAKSHLRVGTFEYAVRLGDEDALRAIADYAISRHYPDLAGAPDNYLAFLRAVCERQSSLIARWQAVGFVHGVMNTDNMAISGETIDYGPCAFMNAYRRATVFSSIDRGGRYAYANQPAIASWNLARLAESLLPLIDADTDRAIAAATEVLEGFPARFTAHWLDAMRRKLGLHTAREGDADLVAELLGWMEANRADFTNTFRALSPAAADRCAGAEFAAWHTKWAARLDEEGTSAESALERMRQANPAVIARNHRVEEALEAAEERDDFGPTHRLVEALRRPYEDLPEGSALGEPPADEAGYRTFCGT